MVLAHPMCSRTYTYVSKQTRPTTLAVSQRNPLLTGGVFVCQ